MVAPATALDGWLLKVTLLGVAGVILNAAEVVLVKPLLLTVDKV